MTYTGTVMTMTDDIRKEIVETLERRGISRYKLAKDLDKDPANVYRLLKEGGSGEVPQSWQEIFDYLGLELFVKSKGEDNG